MHKQTGQAATEYLVIFIVLSIALVIGTYVLLNNPEWAKRSSIIVIYGTSVAGLGWSIKRSIEVLNSRAQLLILELLSENNQGLTRKEIEAAIINEALLFRIIPGLTIDALSHLIGISKINIAHKKYSLIANESIQTSTITPTD